MDAEVIERLRRLMAGRSARQWASELGVPHRTLLTYLEGREPPSSFIATVCARMGVSADWLLLGRGDARWQASEDAFQSACRCLLDVYVGAHPDLKAWLSSRLRMAFPPNMLEGS